MYWDETEQSGHITDEDGSVLPVIQGYWFAWYTFHTDTLVFTGNEVTESGIR